MKGTTMAWLPVLLALGADVARCQGSRNEGPASAVEARRRQYMETLQKILPHSTVHEMNGRISAVDKDWEDWVRRTGELPPDFASMPSIPELPDPLAMRGDSHAPRITTPEQWRRQREWIGDQLQRWIYGRMPPPPGNVRAVATGSRTEGNVTAQEVRLEFGPDHRSILHLQLYIPGGTGPFPVFLTNQPPNHGWIYTAIRRGYIACFYQATDPNYGYPDDSDKFIEAYPDYDFACIARWAWAGMRAVDFLYTMPQVDRAKIGITGHSRNGKQALVAAAFDERIGAVIASGGTTGESLPWRYTTDTFAVGSIEGITGGPHNAHWFVPRLRFFVGREQKLPVDQNMLLAMVAPRGLMMYAGHAEHEGNPFGYEQAYRSAREVYRLLGHEDRIWLSLRAGEHNVSQGDLENFVDFLDTVFGRKSFPKLETWTSGYTFEGWLKTSSRKIDAGGFPERKAGDFGVADTAAWDAKRRELERDIAWALGEEPPGLPFQGPTRLPASREHWLLAPFDNPLMRTFGRPLTRPGMGWAALPFGDGLKADLYYPQDANGQPKPGKLPLVVWLHSHSYATGYSRYAGPPFESLTRRGFAVLAFDQLGFGIRVPDARYFYEQYPQWSLMGKMVADTRAAISAATALDEIDASRIYLFGYGLGAKVGLLAAALDGRVRALAVVNGFDPLRLDTADKGTEGIRHYSHLHGLMPRLGFFVGSEARLPFDNDEALALIAPRPVLLIAPEFDRYAHVEDVRREVEGARVIYHLLGREDALQLETPFDFARFPRLRQESVFDWLEKVR